MAGAFSETVSFSQSALELLRVDHAQLYLPARRVGLWLREAEAGWLTIDESGQVCFFAGAHLNLAATPTFTIPSALQLYATPGRMHSREVRLSGERRLLTFSGLVRPRGAARSSPDARREPGPAVPAAGLLGDLKSVLVDNRGHRERARRARAAWFPVLDGIVPWYEIEPDGPVGELSTAA